MFVKLTKTLIAGLLVVNTLLLTLQHLDVLINITGSYPIGLYLQKDLPHPLEKAYGNLVVFCPDLNNQVINLANQKGLLPHGSGCENGMAPMMKKLVGLPGQKIEIKEDGVHVDDHLLPNSTLDYPYFSKILKVGDCFTLEKDQFWVMSDHTTNSLDSRYIGIVKQATFTNSATPYFIIK